MKRRKTIAIIMLTVTVIMIINSESIADVTLNSMKITATNIIPSLFPFMVISSLIVSSGAADILGRIIPISRIFKLPHCASTPIMIGALCGFPLGAVSSVELYKNGYISKVQTEVLISISNITGPSFIVFVIGKSIWNNIRFGIFLYLFQLISAISAALIVNRIIYPVTASDQSVQFTVKSTPFLESLSDAIRNASLSSLTVCGFITFFAVIIGSSSEMLSFIPQSITSFISAILEFSEASRNSVLLPSVTGAFMCGFAIGWSGVSVLCQTAYFTAPHGLSLKRYITVKILEGIFLGILSSFYAHISRLEYTQTSITVFEPIGYTHYYALLGLLTTFYSVYMIKKRKYA